MKKAEKLKRIREDLSLTGYVVASGYTLVRKGKYYSLKEHDSVMIDPLKNVYWQNSKMGYDNCIGRKGTIIDFAVNFNGMSMYEAIKEFERILGIPEKRKLQHVQEKKEESTGQKQGEIILPQKEANMRKIYAYLIKTRHISKDVVNEMVHRKMLYQDTYGNCVFLGYDVENPEKVIFGCKRGTNTYKKFTGDLSGCDYAKGFYVDNKQETLIVTESVIDALSIMTLLDEQYKKYNYLALGGTGKWEAVRTYLDTGNIKKILIATDNDKSGIDAGRRICSLRKEYKNIEVQWKLPPAKYGKDWNDVAVKWNRLYSKNIEGKKKTGDMEKIMEMTRKRYGKSTETVEQTVSELKIKNE